MAVSAHHLSRGQGSYPVATSSDGWVARIAHFEPRCKSCDPLVADFVLQLLIVRAQRGKHQGRRVTLPVIRELMESEHGVTVRFEGFKDHVRKHVTIEHISARPPAEKRGVPEPARIEVLRNAVQARTAEPVPGTPDHIGYLQRIVGIATAVINEFPERVTPEMGLRASTELARIKASAERDRMLEVLAFASGQRARAQLPIVEVVMEESRDEADPGQS